MGWNSIKISRIEMYSIISDFLDREHAFIKSRATHPDVTTNIDGTMTKIREFANQIEKSRSFLKAASNLLEQNKNEFKGMAIDHGEKVRIG